MLATILIGFMPYPTPCTSLELGGIGTAAVMSFSQNITATLRYVLGTLPNTLLQVLIFDLHAIWLKMQSLNHAFKTRPIV